jgi:NADPH-dependent 2,4-dienoyl-CoA reductase/sulfur reductase-like enzyme/nitrite reductase/ring-hydroxylating ferredoxin subunit
MAEIRVPAAMKLKDGDKKVIAVNKTKILFIHHAGQMIATQPKCPHAGGPLDKGAVCNGRLVCPWHMGTFALPTGALVEPPAMESLKTYPVRMDGQSVFVDLTEQSSESSRPASTGKDPDKRTFLLVGAGAANAMAATTLRNEGFKGSIVVVDPVADEPIDRTQLSKQALTDKTPLAKTHLGIFGDLDVKRTKASIIAISSKRRQVRLDNGKTINFDAAVVATGGVPKRLNIPGADNVYTIRHSEDVRRIRSKAKKGSKAVIIGTSFIGLETASALAQRGVHVTVVGEEELPFAKQFGERVAQALLALHKNKGVKFLLGATVVSISARNVTAAKDGKKKSIPADFILMGVGIAPNLQFEHDLPIAEDGGIRVDQSLRAANRVWVAGDIATVRGRRIEHWRLAQQHGMVAARQMMGSRDGFRGVPFFWTFHFGKRLNYLGHADEWDEVVYRGNVKKLDFLAFYVKDGRVLAILSCGKEQETAMLSEMMRNHLTIGSARSWIRNQDR